MDPGEDEEYFTFISREAWLALNDWIDYRRSSGEMITDDTWLMRRFMGYPSGPGNRFTYEPKKLTSLGIKRLMERAIWAQGLRKKLDDEKKRHPYQTNYLLRKWFKTRCENAGMKPINIEKLMNHSTGISDSYYLATEQESLEDYLKAIDMLSIDDYKLTLQKQVGDTE